MVLSCPLTENRVKFFLTTLRFPGGISTKTTGHVSRASDATYCIRKYANSKWRIHRAWARPIAGDLPAPDASRNEGNTPSAARVRGPVDEPVWCFGPRSPAGG